MLSKYVDALRVSIQGRLKDEIIEALGAAKEEALREFGDGRAGDFAVPGLPGGPLRISPTARNKYEFILRNGAVYLEVTSWANLPALIIQPMAYVFYQHDLGEVETMVDDIAAFFLEPGFEILVSSFHLAVDFQGEGFELPDARDVVTRARKRKVEGDGPEPNTMTFGRRNGALQVQIYDKTEELKKSGKGWMRDVWREGGRYTEGLAAWRVEYRFSRKKLRELSINTIADLRVGMGDLVQAVVGDGGAGPWIRIASPDTRGHGQDRRPAAPWWEDIKAASLDGIPATGLLDEPSQREPDLGHTETMLFAYLEKWMALGGGEGLHPSETPLEEFTDLLARRYSEHLDFKGTSRLEAIDARREKMGLGAFPLDAQ